MLIQLFQEREYRCAGEPFSGVVSSALCGVAKGSILIEEILDLKSRIVSTNVSFNPMPIGLEPYESFEKRSVSHMSFFSLHVASLLSLLFLYLFEQIVTQPQPDHHLLTLAKRAVIVHTGLAPV
jgi:hypothetical protein